MDYDGVIGIGGVTVEDAIRYGMKHPSICTMDKLLEMKKMEKKKEEEKEIKKLTKEEIDKLDKSKEAVEKAKEEAKHAEEKLDAALKKAHEVEEENKAVSPEELFGKMNEKERFNQIVAVGVKSIMESIMSTIDNVELETKQHRIRIRINFK